MFKLTLKVSVLALVLMGAFSVLSSGHAAAYNCNAAPEGLGFNIGEGDDSFAGMTVKAVVGKMTNGADDPNHNNWKLSGITYKLHSDLPDLPNNLHYDNSVPTNNVDARIFTLNANGQTVDRNDSQSFQTGENLYDTAGNWHSFSCPGWSAVGPGRTLNGQDEFGNRHGLDCGQNVLNSSNHWHHKELTRYWINNIPNPFGEAGYWGIEIAGGPTYQNGTMDSSSKYFVVGNGITKNINLVWHRTPPPPPLPTGQACSYFFGSNTSGATLQRMRVDVTGVVVGRIKKGNNPSHPVTPYQDIHENIPDDNGSTNSYDEMRWWYTANANTIQISYTPQTWDGSQWNDGTTWYLAHSGGGTTWTTTPSTYNCYSASCSITNVDGDGPGGIILAGGTVHVHGTYKNTSPKPDKLIIYNPALQDSDKIHTQPSKGIHTLFTGPAYNEADGYEYNFYFNYPAPNEVTNGYLNFTPVYHPNTNPDPIGGGCDVHFPVYQKFKGSVSASSSLSPTIEHPDKDDYKTTITLQWDGGPSGTPSHDVKINDTNSEFYKDPAVGAKATIDSNTGGTYKASSGGHTTTTLSGQYAIPDGSYRAGDEFCAHIHADYTSGWVGPDNNVLFPSNPKPATSCDRVVNEPYFQVHNGSISARDGLNDPDGTCSATASNSGLLAGWNNNLYLGVDRGAGTQLSALALIKITGVASAQTDISRSPTDLTFANTVTSDKTTSIDSPSLGGNFAGTPACDSVPKQDPGASNIGGSSSVPATGGYEHSGDMRVTGGTVSGNTSIFVEGDVYIGNNITYSGSGGGWSPGHTPSFVLVATGNIYIDNNVTRLDGTYIAQPKDSTHGGTIYTCGTSSYQVNNSYSGCNNQLLVNGSFKANHVKLLRTFGSLRDEEPDPAPAPSADPTIGLRWCYHGGFVLECGDMDGNDYRCTNINEPSEPSYWQDNKLCVPKTSSLELAWTYVGGSPLPYCQKWAPPGASNWPWTDNYLCMNQNRSDGSPLLKLGTANIEGQDCTKVIEPSDSTGQWDTGYWLCAPFEDISSADPADSGTVTEDVQWSSCGSFGNPVGGEACLSDTPAHLNLTCVHVNEPIEDSGGNAWKDNYLCVPNSSDLKLYWTHCATYPGCSQSSASIADDPGLLHLDNVKNGVGTPGGQKYPYCTKWDVPPDYKQTWGDNYLCMNKARPGSSSALLRFFDDPPEDESCITISEIADHDGQWQTGYYLCQPPSSGGGPTPTGPPYTDCENAGIQVTTFTCAAEVIRFSPELYLTKDTGTQPQNQGATQYDAITSLPPVL